jgi:DNA-binding XRE family transcriptional regulator
MKVQIHPQLIIKNSFPEFVVLTYSEYEAILEALEDKEDIAAIKEFRTTTEETIPWEVVKSISDGKNAIRVFREFRGIPQAKLAKQAGISRQYLCQIENKERQGSSKILKKIAAILQVNIESLIP